MKAAAAPKVTPAVRDEADAIMIAELEKLIPKERGEVKTELSTVREARTGLIQSVRRLVALVPQNGKPQDREHPLVQRVLTLAADIDQGLVGLPPEYKALQTVDRPGRHVHRLQHITETLRTLCRELVELRTVINMPGGKLHDLGQRVQSLSSHIADNGGGAKKKKKKNDKPKYVPHGERHSAATDQAEVRKEQTNEQRLAQQRAALLELEGHRAAIQEALANGNADHLMVNGDGDTLDERFARVRTLLHNVDRIPSVADYRQHFAGLYQKCLERGREIVEQREKANAPPTMEQRVQAIIGEAIMEVSPITTIGMEEVVTMLSPLPRPEDMSTAELEAMDWPLFFQKRYETLIAGTLRGQDKIRADKEANVPAKAAVTSANRAFDQLAAEDFNGLMDVCEAIAARSVDGQKRHQEQIEKFLGEQVELYTRRTEEILTQRRRSANFRPQQMTAEHGRKLRVGPAFSTSARDFTLAMQRHGAQMVEFVLQQIFDQTGGLLVEGEMARLKKVYPAKSFFRATGKKLRQWFGTSTETAETTSLA